MAENELWTHRRDAADQHLAQQPLDVEFLGVAHAAQRHDGARARLEAGLGAQVLGGVGLGSAGLAPVVKPSRPHGQEVGRFKLDPALGEGVLDGLVLADGAPEDDALAGVAGGAFDGVPADADGFRANQHALRVEAV